MSTMNRRELFRSVFGGVLQAAGTVVLACSALPAVAAEEDQRPPAEGDLQKRADRLASEEGARGLFRRGGFANGGYGGGGVRGGGFANGGYGGVFRRGGFANGGYGGG